MLAKSLVPPADLRFLSLCTLRLAHPNIERKDAADLDVRSAMFRSPSPASSLDYFASDKSGNEEEYNPASHRRAPTKRRAPAGKSGPSLKINLSALQRARAAAVAHPVEGPIENDDELEDWGDPEGLIGSRGVDLSGQPLKDDHAIRPLWVDENGSMYVSHSSAVGSK